jgi:hypothetical protein
MFCWCRLLDGLLLKSPWFLVIDWFCDGLWCSWARTVKNTGCSWLLLAEWCSGRLCILSRVSILFITVVVLLWPWHLTLAYLVTHLCVLCCCCTAPTCAVVKLEPWCAQFWSAAALILVLSRSLDRHKCQWHLVTVQTEYMWFTNPLASIVALFFRFWRWIWPWKHFLPVLSLGS